MNISAKAKRQVVIMLSLLLQTRRMSGKCNFIAVWILVFAILWLTSVTPLIAQDEKPNLGDAKQAWPKYIDAVLNGKYRIEGQYIHTNLNDGSLFFDNKFEMTLCGENALSIGHVFGTDRRALKVSNSKYRFRAESEDAKTWKRKSLDVPFQLERQAVVSLPPDDPVVSRAGAFQSDAHRSAIKALCRGLIIWENWFPAMVDSSDFKIQQASYVHDNGKKLAKFEFLYQPKDWHNNIPRDGWVTLDPNAYWLIASAELKGEWGEGESQESAILRIENKYEKNFDGTQIPILIQQDIFVKGSGKTSDVNDLWTHKYVVSIADCRPDEFTLTAFGLPEPELPKQGIGARWMIIVGNLLLAAAAVIFVAITLWKKSRTNASA